MFCCMRITDEGIKIIQLLLNHKADPNAQDEVATSCSLGLFCMNDCNYCAQDVVVCMS